MTGREFADENVFDREVVTLASFYGWKTMRVGKAWVRGRMLTPTTVTGFDIRGKVTAWPDRVLWHHAGGLIIRELKMGDSSPFKPMQQEVLASLARSGVDAKVWRPADWDEIHATLSGPRAT